MRKLIVATIICVLTTGTSYAGWRPPAQPTKLADEGTEKIVNYEKYGKFKDEGKREYVYEIIDQEGLSKAVGEGIYPNGISIYRDQDYRWLDQHGWLEGTHWDFVNTDYQRVCFYKWATTDEDLGVKLFYTALALEKAGLIEQAIKAYYAIVVHYPFTVGWTYWKTPWYIGKVSIDKIDYLTRTHPKLGMKLVGAKIVVEGGFDDNVNNDIVITDPGRIISCKPGEVIPPKIDLSQHKIIDRRGKGKVHLVQYDNGHWQLLVDNKPYEVKCVAYTPNKVGLTPDNGSLVVHRDWMFADFNKNGRIDGPYDAFVDANGNNKQEAEVEPAVGDFQLMKDMGVNTVRLYHHAYNKKLLRELYENYGIRCIVGDYLGMYTIGSGAEWYAGTDYSNPEHRKNMFDSVKEMVKNCKNEPWVLMWMLGNENNYGVACSAKKDPDTYYKFVNEVAKWIHSVDPEHPVAICNGDVLYLDKFAKYCPDVDIYGTNTYRGNYGFGRSLWENIKDVFGHPVLITEYGCPAYMHGGYTKERMEEEQAEYLKGCWEDIKYNMAGSGQGNSLGGVLFEWCDEWWKAGPPPENNPAIQERYGQFIGPFPDGWMYEEWLGVVSQANGTLSPFIRHLRKAYFVYKELWNE